MSESVFVTGGTGFIGRNVLERLVEKGYDVTALEHSRGLPDEPWTDAIDLIEGDVTDLDSLPTLDQTDAVIHLAGAVSVKQSIEKPNHSLDVNISGTKNVIEQARLSGVRRFMYLSSAAIYGNPDNIPISESQVPDPLHPYAAGKLAGEHIAEAYVNTYNINVDIARAFTTYGPGQASDNLIPEVINQLQQSPDTLELGNLSPTRDFIHVADVAAALIKILSQEDEGVSRYNVGTGQETQVREVVELLRDLIHPDATIQTTSSRDESVEIPRLVADCRRLRDLGWEPKYNLEAGMKQIVENYST